MAAVLLSGCATGPAPRADISAAAATEAMAQGHTSQAIEHAEAAVLSDPHNATFRTVMGDAYLEAGRFASAETAFDDAMTLGDTSPRAALSLALAKIAQAEFAEAAALLNDWDGEIAKADLGLALALSGQPERGIHIMSNAIRGGENTVKMRQNLAYAFATAGRWREARLMAQQDLPAGEVNARMEQWAALSGADSYQHRIANLLKVPVGTADHGQPARLALSSTPSVEQLALEAQSSTAPQTELAAAPIQPAPAAAAAAQTAPQLAPQQAPELAPQVAAQLATQLAAVDTKAMPSLAEPQELPASLQPRITEQSSAEPIAQQPTQFAAAFAPPTPAASTKAAVASETLRTVSIPVVQPLPSHYTAAANTRPASLARRTPRAVASPAIAAATNVAASNVAEQSSHLVQLGSFTSEAGAHRAWDIYVDRFPELASREMVISQAVVRGKRYWRVSAGGYDNANSQAMCSRVRSNSGDGCISWAAARPLPGSVDSSVRLARR